MRSFSSKRIVIKGIILSVAVNGFFLYSQNREHGVIPRESWIRLGISLAVSLLFIVGLGLLLARLGAPGGPRANARTGRSEP